MEKGYSLIEVAGFLGIKTRTVRQWIRDGKIKASKLPNSQRWVVLESEIKRVQAGINE